MSKVEDLILERISEVVNAVNVVDDKLDSFKDENFNPFKETVFERFSDIELGMQKMESEIDKKISDSQVDVIVEKALKAHMANCPNRNSKIISIGKDTRQWIWRILIAAVLLGTGASAQQIMGFITGV